jgi:hypothetical protein
MFETIKYEVTGQWRKLQNGFNNLYSSHNIMVVWWVKHVSHTGRWQMEALFWLGSHAKAPLERNMHKSGFLKLCFNIIFLYIACISK